MIPNPTGLFGYKSLSLRSSKKDQSKKSIDFTKLYATKELPKINIEAEKDKIKKSTFDEAIGRLNEFSSMGQRLPIQIMRYILKKFQNNRYGTIADAEKLYDFMRNNYVRNSEFGKAISEMQQVYLSRKEEELVFKIEEIFREYRHTFTFNNLLNTYRNLGCYEKALKLYHEFPEYKDDFTYDIYFQIIGVTARGCQKALKVYYMVRGILKESILHARIINLHKSDLKLTEKIFSDVPVSLRKDNVCRAMLKSYLCNKQFKPALDFFKNGWPEGVEKSESSYNKLISGVSTTEGLKVYKEALDKNRYPDNKLKIIKESNCKKFSLDLHSRTVREGGVQNYGGFPIQIIKVAFLHFCEEILRVYKREYNPRPGVHYCKPMYIEIICGIGAGKTRNKVQTFLEYNSNLKVKTDESNPGVLLVDLNSKTIKELKNLISFSSSLSTNKLVKSKEEKTIPISFPKNQNVTFFKPTAESYRFPDEDFIEQMAYDIGSLCAKGRKEL